MHILRKLNQELRRSHWILLYCTRHMALTISALILASVCQRCLLHMVEESTQIFLQLIMTSKTYEDYGP